MNKQMFLDSLRERISSLPPDEVEGRLAFFGEMIDERVGEGMTEEEAVNEIGTVDGTAKEIMSEIPLHRLVRQKVKPKKKAEGGKKALLIISSPLWIPLLAALIVVIIAVCVVLWAGAASLYVVSIVIAVAAVLAIPAAVFLFVLGTTPGGVFLIGASLILSGLVILMIFLCIAVTRGVLKLCGKFMAWIKSLFAGKEDTDHAVA